MKLVDALLDAVTRIEAAGLEEDEILTFELNRGFSRGVRVHIWSVHTLERVARNAGMGRYLLTKAETEPGKYIFRLEYLEGPESLMFLAYSDPDGSTKGQVHMASDWLMQNSIGEVSPGVSEDASVAPADQDKVEDEDQGTNVVPGEDGTTTDEEYPF